LPASNELQFLREFLTRPLMVASPVPSGRALASRIAEQIPPEPDGIVLELGPGTGAVTRAIRARGVPDSDLIVIESDPRFVVLLRRQLPGVCIVEGDAFAFATLLGNRAQGLRSIVSGLPVLGRPIALRRRFVCVAIAALKPGRPFIQFSYGARPPLPSTEGIDVQHAATVWRNIPPMHVWVYRRSPVAKFLNVTG
jgi:phosphatidylethanolamine/phosphatidyl-N-methylethanolamine N-methyltransferase